MIVSLVKNMILSNSFQMSMGCYEWFHYVFIPEFFSSENLLHFWLTTWSYWKLFLLFWKFKRRSILLWLRHPNQNIDKRENIVIVYIPFVRKGLGFVINNMRDEFKVHFRHNNERMENGRNGQPKLMIIQ